MSAAHLALATAVCGLYCAATAATDYQAPTFSSDNLVNAASGETLLAPYTICSLYGTNLFLDGSVAPGSSAIPTTLAGVTVLIGPIPAGILYLSPQQINLLIPNSLTPGAYFIRVVRDGLSSQPVPITLQEVSPGLFPSSPGFAAAQHADGSPVTQNAPAAAGEVVILYGTGLGRARPDPSGISIPVMASPIVHRPDFQVLLEGTALDPALVQYAGVAPFNAGLYQVNVQLPDRLPAANPEVRVSVAGALSTAGLRLMTSP